MSERNQRAIALFSPTLGGGGAEKVLVNLACGMIDQLEAVDIVVAQATGRHMSHIPRQARFVDLGASRTLCSVFPLAGYLRGSRPRAIICFQDHATVVALWARALSRVPLPIVGTVHTTWSRFLATGTAKTRVLAWCVRQVYARVESVVAVSNGAADNLAMTLNLPRQKIRVIYNPVVGPDLFVRSKDVLEHPWFAPGCPPVIIGIGRLTQVKDFQTLVLAFAQVRRQIGCRLMILGEGEDRVLLAALATATGFGDDIALPGFVENPYKYLAHSSLFVLSSIWEGLPTALIEALALGVPVVSTDCDSGPREILEDGLHGTLVRPADPSALADAMRQALLHKPVVPLGGLHRFCQDRVTQQYRSLVDEISN
jgi:glycosyltransferase involved in cell wall biosynthesis